MNYKYAQDKAFSSQLKYDDISIYHYNKVHSVPLNVKSFISEILASYNSVDYDSFQSNITELIQKLLDNQFYLSSSYTPQLVSSTFLQLFDPIQNPNLLSTILPFLNAWTAFQNVENDDFALDSFFDYLLSVIENRDIDPNYETLDRYQLYFFNLLNNLLIDSKKMRNIFINKNPIPLFTEIYQNPSIYYTISEEDSCLISQYIYEIIINALQDYNYTNKLPPFVSLVEFYYLCHYRFSNNFINTNEIEFNFLHAFIRTSEGHLVLFFRYFKVDQYFRDFYHLSGDRIFPFFRILRSILQNLKCFTQETQNFIRFEIISKIQCEQMIQYFEKNDDSYENLQYIKFLNILFDVNHDQMFIYIIYHPSEIQKFTRFFSHGNFPLKFQVIKLFSTIFSINSSRYPIDFLNITDNTFIGSVLNIILEEDQDLTYKSLELLNVILVNAFDHNEIIQYVYNEFIRNEIFDTIEKLKYQPDQTQEIIDKIDIILNQVQPFENKIEKINEEKQIKEENKQFEIFEEFKFNDYSSSDYYD